MTAHPFDPWGTKIGGIENFVRSMMRHAPPGVESAVIGVTESPGERPCGRWLRLEYEGRPVHFFALFPVAYPNRRARIPLFLRYPLALRKAPPLDNALTLFHRIEPILAPLQCGPRVLFVHGDPREMTGPDSEVKWRHLPQLYRAAERRAVNRARRVFVASRTGADCLRERHPRRADGIMYQPTGYRDDLFFPLPSGAPRENPRRIIFAARFEAQKNPLLALETFRRVREAVPDARMTAAGEGSLRAEFIRKRDEWGLREAAEVPGGMDADRLADAMRGAGAFLMTSRFEGMPIAALEALASGLPVVAAAAGELERIVGNAGRAIPGANAAQLADALIDALQHPDRYPPEVCAAAAAPWRAQRVMGALYDQLLAIE